MALITDTRALERSLLDHIPLCRAMQLSVKSFDGRSLCLHAPLDPNINDKGCAFGGSLASLMTLAAWGLVNLHLGAAGLECDVYVQDSQIRYLAPVWDAIEVNAHAAEGESWDAFVASVRARGKARIQLVAEVGAGKATTFEGRFVALISQKA